MTKQEAHKEAVFFHEMLSGISLQDWLQVFRLIGRLQVRLSDLEVWSKDNLTDIIRPWFTPARHSDVTASRTRVLAALEDVIEKTK